MFIRAYFLFFWLVAIPASADTVPPPASAVRLIEETFQEATAAVLGEQKQISAKPAVAYRIIEDVIAPHVAFDVMARLVAGSHWAAASPDQRRRFTAAFRESLLRTYAQVLAENIDEVARRLRNDEPLLRIHPLRADPDQTRIVVSTSLQLDEGPLPIDYRLYADNGRWRVYDIIILRISFVTNLRAEYDGLLRKHGIEGVITQLAKRNRDRALL